MLPAAAERGPHPGRKPLQHEFPEISRSPALMDDFIQNLIVRSDESVHLEPVGPAFPGLVVMVLGLAVITTELLVTAPITDTVSAFQTMGHVSFMLLIFHKTGFCTKFISGSEPDNSALQFFLFF